MPIGEVEGADQPIQTACSLVRIDRVVAYESNYRALTVARIAERTPPAVNVAISNVPGPKMASMPTELFLTPTRVDRYARMGLNITPQSYRDHLTSIHCGGKHSPECSVLADPCRSS